MTPRKATKQDIKQIKEFIGENFYNQLKNRKSVENEILSKLTAAYQAKLHTPRSPLQHSRVDKTLESAFSEFQSYFIDRFYKNSEDYLEFDIFDKYPAKYPLSILIINLFAGFNMFAVVSTE